MIEANEEDWKTWCRTCGNNNITEFDDDFVKWESLDTDILKCISDFFKPSMITVPRNDGIICNECHLFLKDLLLFSNRCIKINNLYTEIALDYEKFGKCDVSTLRYRYGLDNIEKKLSTFVHTANHHNWADIQDFLKIETQGEYNQYNNNNNETFNDTSNNINSDTIQKIASDHCSTKESEKIETITTRNSKSTRNNKRKIKTSTKITDNDDVDCSDIENSKKNYKNVVKFEEPEEKEIKLIDLDLNVAKRVNPKDRRTNIITCKLCNLEFKKQNLYEVHLKINHEQSEWPNVCPICSKHFATRRSLKRHEAVHSRGTESGKIKGPCVCEHCGKYCKSNSSLREHQVVHSDELPYECTRCFRRFKNVRRLKVHMHIHVGILLNCETCGQKFNTKRTLNQHMVVHSEQKKYKCNYCENEYKRARTLKTHLILHTGQKPYKCPFCDRTFADGSNCRSHKKKSHPIELAAMEAAGEVHITTLPKLDHLQPK